jgi:hypothetical protein
LIFVYWGSGARSTLQPMPPIAALAIGTMIGGASMYCVFRLQGTWESFVACVRSATPTGASHPFADRLVSAIRNTATMLAREEFSLSLMLLFALLALTIAMRRRASSARKIAGFAIATIVLVPIAMNFAGKFPVYYSWMAYVPAVIAAGMLWERIVTDANRLARVAGATLLALACVLGLPLRLALVAVEWRQRDYGPVERLVEGAIRPSDWVYCDYAAYYPVKRIANWTFLEPYRPRMTQDEKARTSVLVISPRNFEQVTADIGGAWEPTGERLPISEGFNVPFLRKRMGARLYDLSVYRRASSAERQ